MQKLLTLVVQDQGHESNAIAIMASDTKLYIHQVCQKVNSSFAGLIVSSQVELIKNILLTHVNMLQGCLNWKEPMGVLMLTH